MIPLPRSANPRDASLVPAKARLVPLPPPGQEGAWIEERLRTKPLEKEENNLEEKEPLRKFPKGKTSKKRGIEQKSRLS